MKKSLTLVLSLLVLSACSAIDTNKLTSYTPEKSISGSGYESLRGAVINYGYDGFDDFNLAIYTHATSRCKVSKANCTELLGIKLKYSYST